MIRPVLLSDANSICDIYNEYIENSTITFEETAVTTNEMTRRIEEATKDYPWLVCEVDGKVIGYTCGKRWRDRAAYRKSVETGIYLDSNFLGRGFGTMLKKEILEILREQSYHAVISGIALPNPASVALNEKFGFEKVAHFKEVGYKFGRWVDVGYWELIL